MKLRKLNGWQRIGVILSIVWVLGGVVKTRFDLVERLTDGIVPEYRDCRDTGHDQKDADQCVHTMYKDIHDALAMVNKEWPWEILFFVLIPLPLAWGSVYGSIGLVRWVRNGFNKQSRLTPSSDSAGESQGTYPLENIDRTDIGDIPTHATHVNCQFLELDQVPNEEEAIRWSINAAVGRNRVYSDESNRDHFREEWGKELRKESQRYRQSETVSDSEHCKIIAGIADRLSAKFGYLLNAERLRFGTSQKAFNLYLKYLWHLGEIPAPPHCPFDSIVLEALGLYDSWTKSDDEAAYLTWVSTARRKAGANSIPEWECATWLRGVSN